ncbi:hypothetical protein [Bacillus sp. Marseille-Q1617]|uniref:hypothetical protein n=1 Tax=Bacillus sp. Marseille-Q1617 TaxID=2736887 RepID=UPI00158D4B15|nr:hypothetical protein [Bacillus sp. Marseille-Q1617]
MENLPELAKDKISEMEKLQLFPSKMDTSEDLVEWMISFLSSPEISEEEWIKFCHSEVHILIPADE